ncbi:MAG: AAA family ATPase [Saprospiraceae bacterium]|nr:AAA family ATPase [Saprospiraceae bacterium]
MDNIFISNLKIKKVRHLQDFDILLSEDRKRHLLLTGKNGSGKTSLLTSLPFTGVHSVKKNNDEIIFFNDNTAATFPINEGSGNNIIHLINSNRFNNFSFSAYRELKVEKSKGVIDQISSNLKDFEKFLAKKRTEQAFLSFETGHEKEVKKISDWFGRLEISLKYLLEDDSLRLATKRIEDKVSFTLSSKVREEFDFNTLASGHSSILYVFFAIMQKMQTEGSSFDYNEPGIVIIDEIEAHLHVSLQKKILPFLTDFFPNIQFIVSTHSPFILQSLKDAVIFDLETKKRFEDFSHYSSETILETFYEIDKFSEAMKKDMITYEEMIKSKNGVHKEEILSMRKQFLEVPDIEVSYWIKDMDIKYRDKIKALLADD